ncbi:MAG TPA: hypothetical protein VHG08_20135 [Longimicrobium sp.]|nr:hypothetical protein [Longimicrobium sp.]
MSTSLRAVLQKHAGPVRPVYAGADETAEAPAEPEVTSIDRAALRSDLGVVRRSSNRWFAVCAALLSTLFAATLWVVIAYVDRPEVVRAAVAALGVSSAGLVTMMLRMWKSKSAAEYLITLAAHLDAATMKTVIEILAKQV